MNANPKETARTDNIAFNAGISVQIIVVNEPVSIPAIMPVELIRFQCSDSSIAGPKDEPNPDHA